MSKRSGVKNGTLSQVSRRKRVIVMLEHQLELGTKHNDGIVSPLTDSDIKRINKELSILKARV